MMCLLTQDVIDAMEDMIFIMRVGEERELFYYEAINHRVIEMINFTSDVIGQTIDEANPSEIADYLKPQYQVVVDEKRQHIFSDEYYLSTGQRISKTILNPIIVNDKVTHIVATVRDMTKVHQLEAQSNIRKKRLELSKERYKSLFDQNTDPIGYINISGDIVKMNDALKQMADYVRRDTPIKNIFQLIDEAQLGDFKYAFYQTVAGFPQTVHVTIGTTDNVLMQVQIKFIPMKLEGDVQGVYGVFRDLTTEHFAKTAMLESEKRFRLIAEHSSDLIEILDMEGNFVYTSPSHEHLLGYTSVDLANKQVIDLVTEKAKKRIEMVLRRLVSDRLSIKEEIQISDLFGDLKWFDCQFEPIFDDDGNYHHTIVVARDIEDRKRYEHELKALAYQDPLTGLANRRKFNARLEQVMSLSIRKQKAYAVLMLDIDDFKGINDKWGHDAGDTVIVEISQRLQSQLREMDTVARLGGDEFIILLPEVGREEELTVVIERLEKSLASPHLIDGHLQPIGTSMGAILIEDLSKDVNYILKQADRALYEAKRKGKNRTILNYLKA